eukprot:4164528-Alexandrium_andersonii.AAC.1
MRLRRIRCRICLQRRHLPSSSAPAKQASARAFFRRPPGLRAVRGPSARAGSRSAVLVRPGLASGGLPV